MDSAQAIELLGKVDILIQIAGAFCGLLTWVVFAVTMR